MHKTKLWVFLVFLASFIIVYQHFIVCINQSEEKFLEWLRANGAEFSSVDLVTLEHYGRGLVSNRFIQKGTLILSIPERLILSMENLENMSRVQRENVLPPSPDIELYELLMSYPDTLSPTDELALFLVGARHQPHSLWTPYITVLPQNFTTTLYWSDEDLNWLQKSTLRSFTLKRKAHIQEMWFKYAPFLQQHPKFFPPLLFTSDNQITISSHNNNNNNNTHFDPNTDPSNEQGTEKHYTSTKEVSTIGLREFKWALSIVWSRVFALRPGQSHGGLVPLADMMNAAPPTQTPADFHIRVERQNDAFNYIANVDIEKGKQIFAPYGVRKRLSNAQLLMDYGFVWSFNPHDVVIFHFEIPLTDPYHDEKVELLEQAHLFRDDYAVYLHEYPKDLIAAMRISCFSVIDLQDPQLIDAATKKQKIHETNEKCALMTLLGLAQKLLAEYTTSIDEDAQLLNSHTLTQNQRAAVIIRKSEKEIITDLINRIANLLEEDKSEPQTPLKR